MSSKARRMAKNIEQFTEKNPEVVKEMLPDTPLAKEAEQITNDTDSRNDEVSNEAVEQTLDDIDDEYTLQPEATTKDFNKPGTISNDEFVDKYYKPFNDDGFNGEMPEDIPYSMENTPILRGNYGLMNPQPVWDKPATDLPALRSANLPAEAESPIDYNVYDLPNDTQKQIELPKEAPKDIKINPNWGSMTQSSGSPAGDIPVTAQPQATPQTVNTGMIGSSFGLPHMSTSAPSPTSVSGSKLPNAPISTARTSGIGVKNIQTTTKQVATIGPSSVATLKHNNGSAGIASGKVSKGGSLGFHANKLPNGGGHTAINNKPVDTEDLKNTMIEALKKRILMAPESKRNKYGIEISGKNINVNGISIDTLPPRDLYILNKQF